MLTPAAYGLGLALVVIAGWTVANFLPARAHASDYSQVYVAARAQIQGRDAYALDLRRYAQEQGLEFTELLAQATNPPLLMRCLRPLGGLTVAGAFRVFVGIEIISLLAVFAASIALLGPALPRAGWALAAGLVCCSMPVFMHFWFSQVQLSLLALALAGVLALRRGWPWLACVLLTLVAVLKLYPVPLALLPALNARGRQRWTLLGWTAACIAGWVIVPGVAAWISFYEHATPFLRLMAGGQHYNFTVASLVMALTGWVPLAGFCSAAVIGLAWWRCARHEPDSDASLGLLLVATVMCSMVAWVHYLVWLIVPVGLLAGQRRWGLLVVALVCFNLAGSNPLDAPKLLNASVPLFVMAWLYGRFSCAIK